MGARLQLNSSTQWSAPSSHRARPVVRSRMLGLGVLIGSLLFLGYLWAGYRLGWRWTGLSGDVTLWDWLKVLALPAALGVAPLLLQHRRRLTRQHRTMLVAVLLGFAALVTAGYLMPLPWTGFTGNTLWDWLELVLLPFAIATTSLWADPDRLRRPQLQAGGALVGLFAVLVAAGYLVPWDWTGFRGNTVWDWIQLLLVPVLVPTVVLPMLQDRMADRFGSPEPPAASEPFRPAAGQPE
jgi:hypothetical protein